MRCSYSSGDTVGLLRSILTSCEFFKPIIPIAAITMKTIAARHEISPTSSATPSVIKSIPITKQIIANNTPKIAASEATVLVLWEAGDGAGRGGGGEYGVLHLGHLPLLLGYTVEQCSHRTNIATFLLYLDAGGTGILTLRYAKPICTLPSLSGTISIVDATDSAEQKSLTA